MKSNIFNYSLQVSNESYYRSLSVLVVMDLGDEKMAVLPEYKPYVGVISREEQKELMKILVPGFAGWFYPSCIDFLHDEKRQKILFFKDKSKIFFVDVLTVRRRNIFRTKVHPRPFWDDFYPLGQILWNIWRFS